jgi:hypothetical protein
MQENKKTENLALNQQFNKLQALNNELEFLSTSDIHVAINRMYRETGKQSMKNQFNPGGPF